MNRVPPSNSFRPKPRKIGGSAFQAGLDESGTSLEEFCETFAVRIARGRQWLHDDEDIPDWVPVVLAGLTVPAAKEQMKAAAAFLRADALAGAR